MQFYSRMKIGTKLGFSFGIIIFLIIVSAVLSVLEARSVEGIVKQQNALRTEKLERFYVAREALAQTGIAARNAFIFDNDADAGKELDILDQQKTIYLDALNVLTPLFQGDKNFDTMRKDMLAMADELNRPRKYRQAKQTEEFGKFLINECSPLRRQIVREINEIIKGIQKEVSEKSRLAEESTERAKTIILVISGFAILLGAAIAIVITKGLLKQLGGEPSEVSAIASCIAGGDLSAHIDITSSDRSSIMFAIKEMRDGLVQIVGKIRSGTNAIASASGQIASGNLDLSARTEEQASSLEETASSMEELTSTVKQNADHAHQANQLAVAASEVAAKGGAVVSEVVHTMGEINNSAKKIVDIIAVIDSIAFQTNILALNAAVEAARAGEQGRGFAVVASEVRTLAQRSAAAAKEIKTLIDNSVEKVDAGSRLVDQAGATMQEVVGSIRRVTDIMSAISAASQEQTAGIEQVNQAVVRMDEATQQNAALVEEVSAAAQSMQEQARSLEQLVGTFRVDAVLGDGKTNALKQSSVAATTAASIYAAPITAPKVLTIVPRRGQNVAPIAHSAHGVNQKKS